MIWLVGGGVFFCVACGVLLGCLLAAGPYSRLEEWADQQWTRAEDLAAQLEAETARARAAEETAAAEMAGKQRADLANLDLQKRLDAAEVLARQHAAAAKQNAAWAVEWKTAYDGVVRWFAAPLDREVA